MRHGLGMAGLVGALALLASPVDAAGGEAPAAPSPPTVNDDARQRARVFFEAGIAQYREARYADALRSFQQALATFDSPVFVFNVARTCDRLHDVACALRQYREYRRREPDSSDRAEVDRRIQELAADTAARGLSLVTVESTPAGAELFLDGSARGTTPWAGTLPPGSHAVRLTLPGYADLDVALDVEPARESSLSLPMQKLAARPAAAPATLAAAPPAPAASVPARVSTASPAPGQANAVGHSRISPWTYAVSAAGVAALGAALVYELRSRQSERDVRERSVQLDRVAAYDAMTEQQTTARVLLGVGLGLTAAGATLLVLDLRTPATGQTALTARVETFGNGLALRGTW